MVENLETPLSLVLSVDFLPFNLSPFILFSSHHCHVIRKESYGFCFDMELWTTVRILLLVLSEIPSGSDYVYVQEISWNKHGTGNNRLV